MRLFCRVAIEAVEIESMKVPGKKYVKRRSGVVSTEDVNGSNNGGYEDEAKPGIEEVGIKVYGDGACVGVVTLVIFGCPSEAHAVEGAIDTVM